MFTALIAVAASLTFSVSSEWVQIIPDDQNCAIQSALPWCGSHNTQGKKLTVATVYAVEQQIMALMQAPKSQIAWQSFADKVQHDRPFQGDCDNFVFTTLDLLNRQGYDVSSAQRVMVSLKNTDEPDHMVAIVQIDNEMWVIADGNAKRPYRLTEAKWKPIYISEPTSTKWLKVKAGA